LRKISFHIFLLLTVSALAFISCKGSKQAKSGKEIEKGGGKDSQNEVRFGMMFVDACSARMKGNLEESKKLLVECEKIDPLSTAVKYELATVYKLLGVNDRALFYAKACAEAAPKNEWYVLLLIECHRTLKEYKQSAKLLEGLVKNYPAKMDFKEDLAIEYQRLGQIDKALKVYQELEKNFGVNEELSLRKSKLLGSMNKQAEAEQELIRLSQTDPMETRYYSHLADFYISHHDLEKAKGMYDRISSIDPHNPIVNLALHDYYSSQGKTEEAFEYLKKAFINPDLDVITKASITSSIFDKKMDLPYYREHAGELAEILIKVHPEAPEANALYGDLLNSEGKTLEASAYYYKSAIKERGNFSVWEKLLSVDGKLNRFDSIEHHSSLAKEYFPNIPLFYYFNGYSNIQLRNYKKAVESLRDGLEFVVDNNLLMIDFYKNLGEAYFHNGEFEKSYKAFDDVLKINADSKDVLNQYAYYLSVKNENLEKAEKLARKANELEPENSNYMDTYGWILYKQKRYKEAEPWLSIAAKPGVKNPNLLEHYGDLLFRLGKTSEAMNFWESAKNNGAHSEALLKKIKEKKLDD
jgi:tetratricopeptide (TPR) repeat protein